MGKFLEGVYEQLRRYVRQLAWLNAVPETPLDKGIKSPPKRLSRIERQRADRKAQYQPRRDADEETAKQDKAEWDAECDEWLPVMPEVDAEVAFILGWLYEIGPTSTNGMGLIAITHGEIRSWRKNVGVPLLPWQARVLRSLSRDYVTEYSAAAAADRAPPWKNDTPVDRAAVERKIKNLLRG